MTIKIKRMEEIQRRLALKFRLNKIENSGIFGPILLNELFKHRKMTSALVEGYLKIHTPDSLDPEICWHVWVKDENENVYDINQVLAVMKEPAFDNCDFCYETELENKPEESPETKELKEHWELYEKDKSEFWKITPMKIRNLRAKMFRDNK